MSKKKTKIIVGGTVILLAVSYLLYAGMQETVFYLTPTELRAQAGKIFKKGVRVSGHIEEGSIDWDPQKLEMRFSITDGNKTIPVHYQGVVPDTFKYGVEVIVEGKLTSADLFKATKLMTKCPSKYEPKA